MIGMAEEIIAVVVKELGLRGYTVRQMDPTTIVVQHNAAGDARVEVHATLQEGD